MEYTAETLCAHWSVADLVPPDSYVCAECVKTGARWVHLRKCQTCGVTLCCDSSPNQHTTKHHHATGHPVVVSAEPNEQWAWCYPEQKFMEY